MTFIPPPDNVDSLVPHATGSLTGLMQATSLLRDSLLTEAQTAELLGISTATLSAWRSRGTSDLPFVRVGRSVRYRLSDIEAYLANRTQKR